MVTRVGLASSSEAKRCRPAGNGIPEPAPTGDRTFSPYASVGNPRHGGHRHDAARQPEQGAGKAHPAAFPAGIQRLTSPKIRQLRGEPQSFDRPRSLDSIKWSEIERQSRRAGQSPFELGVLTQLPLSPQGLAGGAPSPPAMPRR